MPGHNVELLQARYPEFSASEIQQFIAQFDEFDSDKSGDISSVELKMIMKKIGAAEMSPADLTKMIGEVDSKGTGTVDIYDFFTMMKGMKSGSNNMFTDLYKKVIGFFNATSAELQRELLETGFRVNLITVGPDSVGKRSFLSTLFRTDEYLTTKRNDVVLPKSAEAEIEEIANNKATVPAKIVESQFTISEGGLKGHICIADTESLGHNMTNTNCWISIVKYLQSKMDERIKTELQEVVVQDNLIHYCLYFIDSSTSGFLSALDIDILSRIQDYVNIVPVLSRADGLTQEGVVEAKTQIKKSLERNGIRPFSFDDSDETVFAICTSTTRDIPTDPFTLTNLEHVKETIQKAIIVQEKGMSTAALMQDCVDMLTEGPAYAGKQRCRVYPWGYVDVNDKVQSSDFMLLKDLLLVKNRLQLEKVTFREIYKRYRTKRLPGLSFNDKKANEEMQKTEEALQQAKKEAGLLAKQLEEERQALARKKADAQQEAKKAAEENQQLAKRLQELQRMMAAKESEEKEQDAKKKKK